jgi:hypothetical protein
MGNDDRMWIDIHGPKNEIDEIETCLRYINEVKLLIYLDKINAFEKSPALNDLIETEGGKIFTSYKHRHSTGSIKFDLLLECPELNFSPFDESSEFRREHETHLHVYAYNNDSSKIEENIIELSKHFPNTLFRYHCEDDECFIWLFICRHLNGKQFTWSTSWQEMQKRRWWSRREICELIAERKSTTITVKCGCELMPCQYGSPMYDCYVEVYGLDKEVLDIFEKRGVKVKQNREELFMHFQYTKNPIKLMEWLSDKYNECYFVCSYSNEVGVECRWENYNAVHYPYVLKKL